MRFSLETFVEVAAGEVGLGFKVVWVADESGFGVVEGGDDGAVH